MKFILQIFIRTTLAVIIGMIIGSERAKHGRAAGMRTHILVSLGATLTSMISIFAKEFMGYDGDVLRLSAQVISGVGFLGAGMIIHRKNNIISGLTTAAGVWTTSVIGIAIGSGFYIGACIVTAFYMFSIILIGRMERHRKQNHIFYMEIDNLYAVNDIILKIKENVDLTYHFVEPKSKKQGNLGVNLFIDKIENFDLIELKKFNNVVFVEEE